MKLSVSHIHKSFGDNHVLQDVDIHAEGGKAVGILGRNGAGKTTAIRIIMGVFAADEGEILIDGKPIDRNKLTIGYLPEERGLYPKKIILEQLIYLAQLRGMSKKDAKAATIKWLGRLQMSDHINHRLDTLSKGNQQKIQLASTLICDPDIIILDEPFSGLDPVNAMLLKDIVKECIAQGKIVLFSSHQMNYIEEFCNDVAILNGGKVVLSGSIKEIKRSYDRRTILIYSKDIDKIAESLTEDYENRGDHLAVKLAQESDKNPLIARLAEQHFDIDEISVYEPSLNDIFVEYTEDRI